MNNSHPRHKSSTLRLAILSGLLGTAVILQTASAATYKITEDWNVGGEGRWDFLAGDASMHRLFITRQSRVDVMDTQSGKIIGSIPKTAGVHGVALAPSLHRGFTSNGQANSVTVFDSDTLAVIQEVAVPGQNPDVILYETLTNHLYTFNGRSNDATILDATSLAIVGSIPLPGKPEFAQDDGHGDIFINIETSPGKLLRIDTANMKVDASWSLPGCNGPTGLALDSAHHRLFSVCDNQVMAVTDSLTGKQVAKVTIGMDPDAVVYDASRGLVLSSNGGGTLSVVHQDTADKYTVKANVPTRKSAKTMAYDESNGRVYLAAADFGPTPSASAEQPHPRPPLVAGSFRILVVDPK